MAWCLLFPIGTCMDCSAYGVRWHDCRDSHRTFPDKGKTGDEVDFPSIFTVNTGSYKLDVGTATCGKLQGIWKGDSCSFDVDSATCGKRGGIWYEDGCTFDFGQPDAGDLGRVARGTSLARRDIVTEVVSEDIAYKGDLSCFLGMSGAFALGFLVAALLFVALTAFFKTKQYRAIKGTAIPSIYVDSLGMDVEENV